MESLGDVINVKFLEPHRPIDKQEVVEKVQANFVPQKESVLGPRVHIHEKEFALWVAGGVETLENEKEKRRRELRGRKKKVFQSEVEEGLPEIILQDHLTYLIDVLRDFREAPQEIPQIFQDRGGFPL